MPPGVASETRASTASGVSFSPSHGNIRIEFPDAENPALQSEHKVFTFGRNPHWSRDILYTPLSGTMPYITEWAKQHIMLEFGDALLRGLGQVIFINNPMAGLLICIAAFVNDIEMAAAGMLGLVSSTLTAYLFKLPRGDAVSIGFGLNNNRCIRGNQERNIRVQRLPRRDGSHTLSRERLCRDMELCCCKANLTLHALF